MIVHGVNLTARAAPWQITAAGLRGRRRGAARARRLLGGAPGRGPGGRHAAPGGDRPRLPRRRPAHRAPARAARPDDARRAASGPVGRALPRVGAARLDDARRRRARPGPRLRAPDGYLTNPALARAFQSFWANRLGPADVGLEDRWTQIAGAVARRLAHEHTLAGYDLMNAPWPGGTTWKDCLQRRLRCVPARAPRAAVAPQRRDGPLRRSGRDHLDRAAVARADRRAAAAARDRGSAAVGPRLPGRLRARGGGVARGRRASLRGAAGGRPGSRGGLVGRARRGRRCSPAARRSAGARPWTACAGSPTRACCPGCAGATRTCRPAPRGPARHPARPRAARRRGDNVDEARLRALDAPHPRLVAGTPEGWSLSAATGEFRATWSTLLPNGLPAADGALSEVWLGPPPLPGGLPADAHRRERRAADGRPRRAARAAGRGAGDAQRRPRPSARAGCTMLRYEAHADAAPDTVWALLACPTRWSSWAPHVRGAWGLGWPQVREGAVGAVRLFGVVPVPARISRVNPGESWAWQVGLVTIDHLVEPLPDGRGHGRRGRDRRARPARGGAGAHLRAGHAGAARAPGPDRARDGGRRRLDQR